MSLGMSLGNSPSSQLCTVQSAPGNLGLQSRQDLTASPFLRKIPQQGLSKTPTGRLDTCLMFFFNVFLTIPKVYEIGIDWDGPWCSHMTGTYCWCLLWPPGPWSVMLGATQAEPAAYPTTRSKCIACMQQLRLRCRVFVATIWGKECNNHNMNWRDYLLVLSPCSLVNSRCLQFPSPFLNHNQGYTT